MPGREHRKGPVLGGWCHLYIMATEAAELTLVPSPARRAATRQRAQAMAPQDHPASPVCGQQVYLAGPTPWILATLFIKQIAHGGQ